MLYCEICKKHIDDWHKIRIINNVDYHICLECFEIIKTESQLKFYLKLVNIKKNNKK